MNGKCGGCKIKLNVIIFYICQKAIWAKKTPTWQEWCEILML